MVDSMEGRLIRILINALLSFCLIIWIGTAEGLVFKTAQAHGMNRMLATDFSKLNVIKINIREHGPVNCFTPGEATPHRCLEVGVIVIFLQSNGVAASISTTEVLDGSFTERVNKNFGDFATSFYRSLMPVLTLAQISPDAPTKKAAEDAISELKIKELAPHYSVADGVALLPKVEKKLEEIAAHYFKETNTELTVTSGTRDAHSQAAAMEIKLAAGDDILALYKNKDAAKEIKKAFDDAIAAGKTESQVIDGMTKAIEDQTKRGIFISAHLRAGAFDVRNIDMSALQKKVFREAVKGAGGVSILEETTPPHFHLQIDSLILGALEGENAVIA
jgi:hypothetical protein